jgi:simple sugar transport system permease protein
MIGAMLFGGINAIQFRMQTAGTTIPATLLNMMPYIFTVVVFVIITWWEAFRKRIGVPAALGLPYSREER